MPLPDLLTIPEIRARLEAIFPEGTPRRSYFTRDIAANTVFVMLYGGMIESMGRWLAPKHVYCMSDRQAEQQGEGERIAYNENVLKRGFKPAGQQWYKDNTRESIRDETLNGLVGVGAAILKSGVATNSGKPRYALQAGFAALFNPSLQEEGLSTAITSWREKHLDPLVLARMALIRQGAAAATADNVEVRLPNGSLRQLSSGLSSVISKAIIEVFAPAFLYQPAIILLSESGNKIVAQEADLIARLGLRIDKATLLPDIILFDLAEGRELLVFVEVVATDGPISESRRQALLTAAEGARILPARIAFVTAYWDRSHQAFRKSFESLAWNTLVWFMTEPEHVVMLREKPELEKRRIFDLIREGG
ncbi:MAG TPA: BsuBI/PstI family type II restriction endonuclease [Thermoanaerobaculia bacterium]|nr:BsuBI/PstI family type II restriction endonuclease [Thermoanaerobaculia bacterium]